MNRVMISQSNYIPWKGFFDSIASVDTYVVFDEVQYTRRDWRNRNKIKTPQGPAWLTIPVEVKGKFTQKISETRISDQSWAEQHWLTIKHNYSKAPHFKAYSAFFEAIYQKAESCDYLTEVNVLFLRSICDLLEIKTQFSMSSDFNLDDGKSERLLGICKALSATDYYSGPSAQGYLDEKMFLENKTIVHYFDFQNYREYEQLYPPFSHAVTVIDLIFSVGSEAKYYLSKNSLAK